MSIHWTKKKFSSLTLGRELELEQDKFEAIFWNRPLETNKTFSERELMSTALSPLILHPSRCVCTVRTVVERYGVS